MESAEMTTPDTRMVLDASTKLAVERTRLAHERTMMAWVRTAVSLISFGFTIYKFFELDLRRGAAHPQQLIGPREFALIMIGIGLASISLATVQHHASLTQLRQTYGAALPRSVAGVAAMGVVALIVVLLRG